MPATFKQSLENCAEAITTTFAMPGKFQPEDQLKSPVAAFLKEAGAAFALTIETVTETHVDYL